MCCVFQMPTVVDEGQTQFDLLSANDACCESEVRCYFRLWGITRRHILWSIER